MLGCVQHIKEETCDEEFPETDCIRIVPTDGCWVGVRLLDHDTRSNNRFNDSNTCRDNDDRRNNIGSAHYNCTA